MRLWINEEKKKWKQILETYGQVQQVVWFVFLVGYIVTFYFDCFSPATQCGIYSFVHREFKSCLYLSCNLVYGVCVCCCVRFHAFQMQTPKTTTTTRRWNQHVRSFAERGKTLNNLFNKNILMLRANEQNTLKSAYKRSSSELLQHLLIFIMSCEV